MEPNDLPVIDWQKAIKLANNKRELAEEMLDLLVQELPSDRDAIKLFFKTKQYKKLLQQVHKLHGALCYSGLTRLKNVIASLEKQLKNNQTDNLNSLVKQVDDEIQLVLDSVRKLREA